MEFSINALNFIKLWDENHAKEIAFTNLFQLNIKMEKK